MASADSTERASLVRVVQNPLVRESATFTAEAVSNVLAFLSVVQPPDGAGLTGPEEMGRSLILQTCIDALSTISGTAD